MRGLLFFALLGVGCGGGSSSKDFCKSIDKLCAADFTDEDIKECSEDIPKIEGVLGEDNYKKLLSCSSSGTCAEMIGCASGAVAAAGEKALEDFERGFGRTFDKKKRRSGKDRDRDDRRDDRTESNKDENETTRTRTRTTTRTRTRTSGGLFRRGEPLPPQCKRFDQVCSEDRDVIARSECFDRVDELKGDPKRMATLVACYEAATTCPGFEKCSTDMWFDIQHDR